MHSPANLNCVSDKAKSMHWISTTMRIRAGQALWVNIKQSMKTFSPSVCSKKISVHVHSPIGDALSKTLSKERMNFSTWFFSSTEKNRKNIQKGKIALFMHFLFEESIYTYCLIKAFCTSLYLTAPKEWKWHINVKTHCYFNHHRIKYLTSTHAKSQVQFLMSL